MGGGRRTIIGDSGPSDILTPAHAFRPLAVYGDVSVTRYGRQAHKLSTTKKFLIHGSRGAFRSDHPPPPPRMHTVGATRGPCRGQHEGPAACPAVRALLVIAGTTGGSNNVQMQMQCPRNTPHPCTTMSNVSLPDQEVVIAQDPAHGCPPPPPHNACVGVRP